VTSRKAFGLLAVAAALVPLLSACNLGHPAGFVAGSNAFCSQAATQIGKLDRPKTLKEQIQYATDRYTIVERLVSEMTDSSLPGGTDGAQLRAEWLQPARASLTDGRTVLAALSSAVGDHDTASATKEFTASLAIGTSGVDTALLQAHRLDSCAKVFEPTAV
jgi:hypothetical protein